MITNASEQFVKSPEMLYSCTSGHIDNASADVLANKSIRVDLALPIVDRIDIEWKRGFSTQML